jgi:phosphatidylethanolamine/phosphatidyl-N-methylethanolamine N-methyltransferase
MAARSEPSRNEARQIFFAHWLRRPLSMGAALPSSPRVARALARQMQLERPGTILELGAGTGTITRGLLEGGCPAERLALVETEPELVAHLEQHYRGPLIWRGDAKAIASFLETYIPRLATVISSLPIKWFPVADQRAIVMPCLERLGPGGHFVQITNGPNSPISARALRINAERVGAVWFHFLPVQIWRYWLD